MLKGIPVSQGYAYGKAFIYQKRSVDIKTVKTDNPEAEIQRLEQAIVKSKEQINSIINICRDDKEKNAIMSAQIEMLEDESFIDMAYNMIVEQSIKAETAVNNSYLHFYELFNNIDDEYLKARAIDLKDASNRILENLIYGNCTSGLDLEDKCILVAYELTPSETVLLDKEKVLGIITEKGTKSSHVAIVANSMRIPAVSEIEDVLNKIKPNDNVSVDGINGYVYVNPDENAIKKISLEADDYNRKKELMKKYIGQKTKLPTGREVELFANICCSDDAENAKDNDAEGIGLFRTEFLFMNRQTLPSEQEQFEQYKSVLQLMENRPVIVRTLDIGGDKKTKCIKIEDEENPFLGNRAIRLCLENKELFYTQIRALLRASVYGELKIMFPMIACFEELSEAKEIINDVKAYLDKENIKYDKNIKIGMMVETPAAVFMAEEFASQVDFFSIGTNDLLQYTTAADRNNSKLAYLNSDRNPVIWRMIDNIVSKAHDKNICVGVCGELANNPSNACLLVVMGVDELSVSVNNVLPIRGAIINMDENEHKEKLEKLIKAKTVKEAELIID